MDKKCLYAAHCCVKSCHAFPLTCLRYCLQAEVGFYYRIMHEKLSKLYYTYGFDYLSVIENIATNAFRVRGLRATASSIAMCAMS